MDDFDLDSMRPGTGKDGNEPSPSATWSSLFKFTSKSHLTCLISVILLSIVSGVITPTLAIIFGKIFDAFTSYGAKQVGGPEFVAQVSRYGRGLVFLGCTSGILSATFFMSWLIFGELQAKRAKEELFNSMLCENMAWYDSHKLGIETLISRLQTHVRELQMATSQPLGFLMQHAIAGITALGVALYYSWALTLVTLGSTPISMFILCWISKEMQSSVESQAKELSNASKLINNAISAIETVKCFNGQEFELSKYVKAIASAARSHRQQLHMNALQMAFIRFAVLAMFVQGFWYGSHLVNINQNTPGEILACFWACLMATQTMEQILPQVVILEKGRAAGAMLKAIASRRGRVKSQSIIFGTLAPQSCKGHIDVNKVSFSYSSRPHQPALRGASFRFVNGETTFIVGKSGSGKSTLANLLIRLYDHEAGEILIDGNRIQTLDVKWLRNNITLVQQQSILFNKTVFGNIVCGIRDQSNVRREDIELATDVACLRHVIRDMPQGLDTPVGGDGHAISGGQRQRVVLARARLRDAPVLILDEATSALDHITKSKVLEQVREWRVGKTTIIITHDLTQIREDDFTYVLDNGVVVQQGLRRSLEQQASRPFQGLRKSTIEILRRDQTDSPYNTMVKGATSEYRSTSQASKQEARGEPRLHFSPIPSKSMIDKWRSRSSKKLPGASRRFGANEDVEMQPLVEDPRNSFSNSTSIDYSDSAATSPLIEGIQGPKSRIFKTEEIVHGIHITSLKDIFATVWPALPSHQRVILVLGFISAFIHAAATPAFSYVFSQLLSTFYLPTKSERSHQALVYSLSILSIAIIDSTASYYMYYLLECSGQHWINTLRTRAYNNILNQPLSFFSQDRHSINTLVETLDRNAEETRDLLGRFAGIIFVSTAMMTIAIATSLAFSWRLTLITLASSPLISITTRAFNHISAHWSHKSNTASTNANAIFAETLTHIHSIRAFTLERDSRITHNLATTAALHTGLRRAVYTGLFYGASEATFILLTALIFTYGAHLTATSTSTQPPTTTVTPTLTVFATLLFTLSHLKALTSQIPHLSTSLAAAQPLHTHATHPPPPSPEITGSIRLSPPLTSIEFTNTTFHPPTTTTTTGGPPTQPVLKNLTLRLSPAKATALTGPSGAGKTTLARLLLNLHHPTSGSIAINNIPLAALHTPTLRNLISYVPQTPHIFPASIAENITYPSPIPGRFSDLNAETLANIRAAAAVAGIDDFVSTLPEGYETLIGAGGTGLSGGQVQRVAIARAVYRKPAFVVMDEAVSGLDAEAKGGVVGRLRGWGGLWISHDEVVRGRCEEVVVLGSL